MPAVKSPLMCTPLGTVTLMVERVIRKNLLYAGAPGMEVAGVVCAGSGVDHFAIGDRVLAMPGHGGYAEIAVAEASAAARIPDAMPFEATTGFAVTYCTAHGAWSGAGVCETASC